VCAPGVSVYRRGARTAFTVMRFSSCAYAETRSDSDNSRRIPPSGNQNAYPSSVLKQVRGIVRVIRVAEMELDEKFHG